MEDTKSDFKTIGFKYLCLEKYSLCLPPCKKQQNWYGIRILFFRVWIGRYYF